MSIERAGAPPAAAAAMREASRWMAALPFAAQLATLLLVAGLILPPLGMLVLGAFTDTEPGVWPHFTLSTLMDVFGSPTTFASLGRSLVFALLVATIALAGGAFFAWLTERTDAPLSRASYLIALIPLLIPGVSMVSGWIMLLSPGNGMLALLWKAVFGAASAPFDIYSFSGMVYLTVLQEFPLAFLWLWPAFKTLNPLLEDAARMSGAGGFAIMRRITLPLLLPSLLAGWLICFIAALGALSVPLMVGLPAGIVLYSTEIYLTVSRFPADMNQASALCLLYVAITSFGFLLYARATKDVSRFNTIAGRGYVESRISLGILRYPAAALGYLFLFLAAGLPALILFWNSLMPYPQPPSLEGLSRITFANYTSALHYGPAVRAVGNSLLLGVASGIVATLLGLAIAWQLQRGRYRRLALLCDQVASLPIAIPGVLLGVALLWLYVSLPLPIYGTLWVLLIAVTTLHLPYAVRMCVAALAQVHRDMDEAAIAAGAGTVIAVRRIIVPLIAPSLLVSVLYVALRSFREYAASIFLTSVGTEVFSVLVIDMWGGGNANTLAAYVSAVMALLACAGVALHLLAVRSGVRL